MFKFGAFELRTETGELSKHGTRLRLQTKPLHVLEALLERPGELITREELCKRLWPAGTFVDFESGLNTATNRLRAALGDSADAPRYIETLPRLGYRFICPVTEVRDSESARILPTVQIEPDTANVKSAAVPETNSHPEIEACSSSNGVKNVNTGHYRSRRVAQALTILFAAVVLLFVFAYAQFKPNTARFQPAFRQLTFRPGIIGSGRFAPDSESIVYSANWGTADRKTYLLNLSGLNSRALDFASGALQSVSREGELALASLDPLSLDRRITLSRVSLRGGAPTIIAEGTMAADWSPNGYDLALVREDGSGSVVEFPAGSVVYTSNGWINCLRVSPRGDQVAFLEHPVRDDTAGYLRIVDRKRRTRMLTREWNNADGLAWSPSGEEVWFTASKDGARGVLYAVSQSSKLRQISDTPSSLRLLDISSTGRALIATDDTRLTMMAALAGGKSETDLSKFDCSHVDDISSDGNLLLFTEGGDAGGQHYSAYLHDHSSGKTYAISSGRGLAISGDGKFVLTIDPQDRKALTITSVGSANHTTVLGGGFEYQWAKFLVSGKELLVGGAYPRGTLMICKQSVNGGKPVPLENSPYLDFVTVAPDGSRFAGLGAGREMKIFDIAKRAVRRVEPSSGIFPVAWSSDGDSLYTATRNDSVYRILKINMQTAKGEVWKTIAPQTIDGFAGLSSVVAAPAFGAYAYSSGYKPSHLYVVDGWS